MATSEIQTQQLSASLFRKRLRKFKRIKRGWYSFLLLTSCYLLSFLLPLVVNNKPLLLRYEGKTYTPLAHFYPDSLFGGQGSAEPNYRALAARVKAEGKGFAWMPLYPYHPNESLLDLPGQPPHAPSRAHWCGTDNRGRDVFARLLYGFRISISFALITTLVSYVVGITIGALLGYYGGRFDISVQRLIEIWSAMPFLYTMIIISSILQPNFALLVVVLTLFGWMGMTYYVRGEFYREKAKDYVQAAIGAGVSDWKIILFHILPNSLVPVVTFGPFGVVAYISVLVSLDYLGFGLPSGTPSWGVLLRVGLESFVHYPYLVVVPVAALAVTLFMVVMVGEAVREAFDPKVFSRLR